MFGHRRDGGQPGRMAHRQLDGGQAQLDRQRPRELPPLPGPFPGLDPGPGIARHARIRAGGLYVVNDGKLHLENIVGDILGVRGPAPLTTPGRRPPAYPGGLSPHPARPGPLLGPLAPRLRQGLDGRRPVRLPPRHHQRVDHREAPPDLPDHRHQAGRHRRPQVPPRVLHVAHRPDRDLPQRDTVTAAPEAHHAVLVRQRVQAVQDLQKPPGQHRRHPRRPLPRQQRPERVRHRRPPQRRIPTGWSTGALARPLPERRAPVAHCQHALHQGLLAQHTRSAAIPSPAANGGGAGLRPANRAYWTGCTRLGGATAKKRRPAGWKYWNGPGPQSPGPFRIIRGVRHS